MAAAILAALAMASCGGESSNGATATVAPTATPTTSTTSPTLWGGCVVPGEACDVVEQYASWLDAGTEELLDHTQMVSVVCTDETVGVDVDPELCDGAQRGEEREAIRVGDVAHLPLTAPANLRWTPDPDETAQDQYGDGAYRIARAGCRNGDGCNSEVAIIDTYVSAAEGTRIVRLVRVVRDSASAKWLIASYQTLPALETLHGTALTGTPPAEEGTPGGLGAYTFYDWPESA
jgi:hypothetical protein